MSAETETVSDVPDILRRICEQRRRRVAAAGSVLGAPASRPASGAVSGHAGIQRAPGAAHGHTRIQPSVGAAMTAPPVALPAGAPGRRFLDAISARRGRAVIAEIKMGSPKLGDLRGRFDPVARAETYADAGAACLSVVVEPDFFHGSYDLLAECVAASGLPAVAKDFVVSDAQLEWARDAGACAVLLIAALHDAAELRRLAGLARGLGLVPLVETHDEADFEKLAPLETGAVRSRAAGEPRGGPAIGRAAGAADSEWELVGINNRDLRTFDVDLDRSADRVDRLPASALKVAESGIHGAADVEKLRRAGFDAFLIGERLVLSGDPAAALAELLGAPASSPASSATPRNGEPESDDHDHGDGGPEAVQVTP